ncbi:hypothetical protein NQ318_016816 [Aromia moschata]|uniref:DDE-1 domain-containing protein n=1 Tax=Aromia moschata TaxID=1265417 RepID=A0AAV8YTQ2_9CUCU|nr:hypothetical protein NQ318_016816 [Aromia moschata]
MVGCPSGSDGDTNGLGWIVEKNFVEFVRHFINFSRCSKERSVLMLLDNHDSHLSIEALDLLKDNGVVAISFPPRCSHKLQPLDRSGFGMGMPTCPGHGVNWHSGKPLGKHFYWPTKHPDTKTFLLQIGAQVVPLLSAKIEFTPTVREEIRKVKNQNLCQLAPVSPT